MLTLKPIVMKGIGTPNSPRSPPLPDMNLQLSNKQAKLRKRSKKAKQSVNPPTSIPKISSKSPSTYRADGKRAFRTQEILQLLHDARQQLKKILSGIPDASIVALGILTDLNCTQIALLSSTTVLTGHDNSALADWPKFEHWKDEEKNAFRYKFTRFLHRTWPMEDISDQWGKVFKVLVDKIHLWSFDVCPENFLEIAEDFDNYDNYINDLKALEHQNKHRLCQAKKEAAKEGGFEIDTHLELVSRIVVNVMLRQQDLN